MNSILGLLLVVIALVAIGTGGYLIAKNANRVLSTNSLGSANISTRNAQTNSPAINATPLVPSNSVNSSVNITSSTNTTIPKTTTLNSTTIVPTNTSNKTTPTVSVSPNAQSKEIESNTSMNISVTSATAYVGANSGKNNTTLIGITILSSADIPTTIYAVVLSGAGNTLSFGVSPKNSSIELSSSTQRPSGFVLPSKGATTFVFDNYSTILLKPNQTYFVQVYGSANAYATSSFVAKAET